MSEITTEKVITPLDINDGDHERFKHYVLAAALEKAYLEGVPCIALCGKRWLPQKDPNRFPLCPKCKELYEAMPEGS